MKLVSRLVRSLSIAKIYQVQLSVLIRLHALGRNMLASDSGVYGPFPERRERAFSMTTYTPGECGSWIAKEVPGPRALPDWLEAWEFATCGMEQLGAVDVGIMDA